MEGVITKQYHLRRTKEPQTTKRTFVLFRNVCAKPNIAQATEFSVHK